MTTGNSGALDAFFDALLDDDADQLYDQAPCGYLSTTPDGVFIKVNQTFLTLTGYDRDDLIGRVRFVDLLAPGGRIYHETHYAPMLSMQGTAREIALDLVCHDGTRLPVLVNAVLDRSPEGTPVVVRTAVFDATQRREYERELLRAKQRAEASEAQAATLAMTLQKTLIPPTPPAIPGLDVATRFQPLGNGVEVGGDFYDVFQVGLGDWVIVIGDVCGKGAEAAVVTALARFTLRAAVVAHARPAGALGMLNDALQLNDSSRFCSVAFLRISAVDGTWTGFLSSAGHPLPMLRTADGELQVIGRPGTLLGVIDDPTLHDVRVDLHPGDTLLLYTDGVPEGRREGEFYGEDRMAAMLSAGFAGADDLAESLVADVLEFQDGKARDDIAVVVVRVPGRN